MVIFFLTKTFLHLLISLTSLFLPPLLRSPPSPSMYVHTCWLQILSQELSASEREREVTRNQLEERVRELGQRLEGYEKIESELDDIVLQAAESE